MSDFGYSTAVTVSDSQRQEFLLFAERCALEAGPEALPYFRTELAVDNKLTDGNFDPVTLADKAIEARIREMLHSQYPDHGIYGEEYGYESGNGLTWVIDPIDGTRAFMSGMLHWGVLLALFDGERPIIGVMYQPYVDELFVGDTRSAWLVRGGARTQLQTSRCTSLNDAVLGTTGTGWYPERELAQYEAISDVAKLTRLGGDCYIHAMVAAGSVDVGADALLSPYDIQALIPIVQGAGGVVTRFDGGDASMGGTVVCVANAELHREVLGLLEKI